MKRLWQFTLREGVGTPEVEAWLRRVSSIVQREMNMWHYQMRLRKEKGQEIYEMVEVYPEVPGEYPRLWSERGITPCGETQAELIEDLQHMLDDAKKYPVFVDTQEEADAIHQDDRAEDAEPAIDPVADFRENTGGDRLPHIQDSIQES